MKWLVFLVAIAISSEIGSSYRIAESEVLSNNAEPSCFSSEEDKTVECTNGNSQLPSDLQYNKSLVLPGEFSCISVTYTAWPIYTYHVQQCVPKLRTSNMCDEIKLNSNIVMDDCKLVDPTPNPNPTSPTSLTTNKTPQPTSSSWNTASPSALTTDTPSPDTPNTAPTTNPTPRPTSSSTNTPSPRTPTTDTPSPDTPNTSPTSNTTSDPDSGLYCVTDMGNFLECSESNSQLPSSLIIDNSTQLNTYACLNVTYLLFIFQQHVVQCSHPLQNKSLCNELAKKNNIEQCILTDAIPSPYTSTITATPTTSPSSGSTNTTSTGSSPSPTSPLPTTPSIEKPNYVNSVSSNYGIVVGSIDVNISV